MQPEKMLSRVQKALEFLFCSVGFLCRNSILAKHGHGACMIHEISEQNSRQWHDEVERSLRLKSCQCLWVSQFKSSTPRTRQTARAIRL